MNILLSLQLCTRMGHIGIEEVLSKAENGTLTKGEIAVYRKGLEEKMDEFDEYCRIIKEESLSLYSTQRANVK